MVPFLSGLFNTTTQGGTAVRPAALVIGIMLLLFVVWDAFEIILLPRRVRRRWRAAVLFLRGLWQPFAFAARRQQDPVRREAVLAVFGPFSVVMLFVLWAIGLLVGFGLVQWALSAWPVPAQRPFTLFESLYFSGTTLFTLGLGDMKPEGHLARALSVVEAGVGFGFVAIVIAYLPVLYQVFSQRETQVMLLDGRAGSPPTASMLLLQYHQRPEKLEEHLLEWERWAAQLLESHLSYPMLVFYRSQHENQSWLTALTAVMDACALVMAGVRDVPKCQAKLTFTMARHALLEVSQTFASEPEAPEDDRLPPELVEELRQTLRRAGIEMDSSPEAAESLRELRAQYEPWVQGLGEELLMELPPWMPATEEGSNWVLDPGGRETKELIESADV